MKLQHINTKLVDDIKNINCTLSGYFIIDDKFLDVTGLSFIEFIKNFDEIIENSFFEDVYDYIEIDIVITYNNSKFYLINTEYCSYTNLINFIDNEFIKLNQFIDNNSKEQL